MVLCQVLVPECTTDKQATDDTDLSTAASAAIPPAIRLGGKHSSPNHGDVWEGGECDGRAYRRPDSGNLHTDAALQTR